MLKTVAGFDRIGEENAFAVLARAGKLQAEGKDVINLGIGQPDFPTPEHIVEAAVKALYDGAHGYTDATGILPLRVAVASEVTENTGTKIDPDQVMILPGGKVTMYAAILMFGEPGAEIMYPDPGFPIYRSMIEYTGATPIPIPIREENGFAFSAEETLALITDKTRLIILNSPANPTGGVTPRAEVEKLVAGLAERPDIAILSDEIYDRMLYDGEEHVSLLSFPEPSFGARPLVWPNAFPARFRGNREGSFGGPDPGHRQACKPAEILATGARYPPQDRIQSGRDAQDRGWRGAFPTPGHILRLARR